MANRTKFTDRARGKFLAELRERCNVAEACRAAKVSRRCAYDHREADKAFAAQWADAIEEGADKLEREAWRRAVEGVDKPITYQGNITASYKEYSDRMLELLLRAHRPEKYRERTENRVEGSMGITPFPKFDTVEEWVEFVKKEQERRREED